MIVTVLNTAFSGATDPSMEYSTKEVWEFNLKDSVEKPQTHWSRPFIIRDTFTPTGIKITTVVANILFLDTTLFTDPHETTESVIEAMHTEMVKFYKKLEQDTTLQITIKSIRYEDVYKYLDINFAGISSVVEFSFTNELC
jgi:hypothetical protein